LYNVFSPSYIDTLLHNELNRILVLILAHWSDTYFGNKFVGWHMQRERYPFVRNHSWTVKSITQCARCGDCYKI